MYAFYLWHDIFIFFLILIYNATDDTTYFIACPSEFERSRESNSSVHSEEVLYGNDGASNRSPTATGDELRANRKDIAPACGDDLIVRLDFF